MRKVQAGVLALLIAAGALLVFLLIKAGALQGFKSQNVFPVRSTDAAGLTHGAAVSIAGVQVGSIHTMSLAGNTAVMTLGVDDTVDLRADATIRIRQRSMLGEKYLELQPGTSSEPLAFDQGLVIPGEQVEIDEMVAALAPVLTAVDPEQISEILRSMADAFQKDPERISRMLDDLETTLANASEASGDLPSLMDQLQGTLGTADRALVHADGFLGKAEDTLSTVDGAVDRSVPKLEGLIDRVDGVVLKVDDMLVEFDGVPEDLRTVLRNLATIDRDELRRLLREEGILIRVRKPKQEKGSE